MDALLCKCENENAEFILDFTSQAGDLKTSVLSKQISLVKKHFFIIR